ncbi:MAG TPA: LytTR family DNA-binding domain-containing protein [Allosphingosinicella sp.]|nr:LytTR family DNA-binding domain-containing protein [Allosphingosinicella sp.]
MTALRALLVDDEPLALRRLSTCLREIADVEVVGATTSSRQAVTMIGALDPDMVFLDIAMPGLDGFDVARRRDAGNRPAIVFVTAYDRHAVRAFAEDAADYLLKPVAPERLGEAVGRARHWLEGRIVRDIAAGGDEAAKLSDEDSFWVHRRREFARVRIGDVLWFEAEGDYVRLHADGESGGLVRMTLGALEARLDPATFIRVHRSAICRSAAIAAVRRGVTGAVAATLANGDSVPVGRAYGRGLKALLKRLEQERRASS